MDIIRNCLNKLVKAKRISPKAAKDAAAIYEGIQGRLSGYMPELNADAQAALDAARIMAEGARKAKARTLRDAIALRDGTDYVLAHPKSRIAGVMGLLTRDIRGEGHLNVESHAVDVEESLLGKVNTMLETYKSKMGGLIRDYAGPLNMVRELFGKDTGDPSAKESAAGWTAMSDYAVARAEKDGIIFRSQAEKDQWRLPQFWTTPRVRDFGQAQFTKDVMNAWQTGGLDVMDKMTGEVAQKIDVPRIVSDAFASIVKNENAGARGSAFNDQMRVFRFKDPETWVKLMGKYGPGEHGVYGMMLTHIRGLAHEIGMAEVLGPSYQSNFRQLLDLAKFEEASKGGLKGLAHRLNPVRSVESIHAAERVFRVLTGEINSVQGETLAGVMGGLRNLASSAKLGSATVTAVPGDSVNAILAAQHNGLSGVRVLARALEGMVKESPEFRAEAARLQITAHAVIDTMSSGARFAGPELNARFSQLANFVIRASGLNFWTQNLKRAFSMEFLAHIAENSGRAFKDLEPAFRGFLDRYGFTAAEWDAIRASPLFETESGARFFDAEGMADKALRDRLMSAIIDERQFAVVEASARTRSITTAGLQRGTFMGEIARSAGMFKSFPISIMLTHGMRSITAPSSVLGVGVALGLRTLLPMTIAGAVALQAKYMLAGKDPRNMTDPMFWFDAFVTGGGSGVYGDLLKAYAIGTGLKTDQKLSDLLLGPAVQSVNAAQSLTIDQFRDWMAGRDPHFGRTLARVVRDNTPGSTLWYARLAIDRLLFDEIQQALDPNYLESFARQEKNVKKQTGQSFWWRPGKTLPGRPPDIGAAYQ